MFQLVDEKTATELQKLIDHHIHSIKLWQLKMGKTIDERREFWTSLAEQESDEFDWKGGMTERPPTPARWTPESGTGMTQQPGLVIWTRPFSIDWESGHFPFDFPINNKQVAEIIRAGLQPTILPDGTGFRFSSMHPEALRVTDDKVAQLLEGICHLSLEKVNREDLVNGRQKAGQVRDREVVGPTLIRSEDVGAGGLEDEDCPT